MRALLLLALVAASAAAQPDASGGTVTTVLAEDVVVRPGSFTQMAVNVTYSYVPAAAAASDRPTLVRLNVTTGRDVVVAADEAALALSFPVSGNATPATGATEVREVVLGVYCARPGQAAFPEGEGSLALVAQAEANGLLEPSRGEHEVRVRCVGNQTATPTATTREPPAQEDAQRTPLPAWLAVAAGAVTARAWAGRRSPSARGS